MINKYNRYGYIEIGDFKETFVSQIDYWDSLKYIEQWYYYLDILLNKNTPIALISSISDFKEKNPVFSCTKKLGHELELGRTIRRRISHPSFLLAIIHFLYIYQILINPIWYIFMMISYIITFKNL